MTDDVENLVLEQLRAIRNKLTDLDAFVRDEFHGLKVRMTGVETAMAEVHRRVDRVDARLDRIEKRLDLVDS